MDEGSEGADMRVSDGEPLVGTWPQAVVKLGVWLASLTSVAVLGCFLAMSIVTYAAACNLALATGLAGLVAVVGGGIGVRSEPDGPRQIDHRAIRHGLLLMLAAFVLGVGIGFAIMSVINAHLPS
ncbi:MAG TPA: hypothetical protein VGB85_09970 [Nannocystis sp.]|jgi:hypothetical protein